MGHRALVRRRHEADRGGSGFGGQGKTYLAGEAGRWLRRTGMFECVCFVGYADVPGEQIAVEHGGEHTSERYWGENLIDADAATEHSSERRRC